MSCNIGRCLSRALWTCWKRFINSVDNVMQKLDNSSREKLDVQPWKMLDPSMSPEDPFLLSHDQFGHAMMLKLMFCQCILCLLQAMTGYLQIFTCCSTWVSPRKLQYYNTCKSAEYSGRSMGACRCCMCANIMHLKCFAHTCGTCEYVNKKTQHTHAVYNTSCTQCMRRARPTQQCSKSPASANCQRAVCQTWKAAADLCCLAAWALSDIAVLHIQRVPTRSTWAVFWQLDAEFVCLARCCMYNVCKTALQMLHLDSRKI